MTTTGQDTGRPSSGSPCCAPPTSSPSPPTGTPSATRSTSGSARSTASTTTTTASATMTRPCSTRRPTSGTQAIIAEMHRLESAQADLLLDQFGDVRPGDRLLDAGSGRGGTSFMANLRFGCQVDGVSISEAQVEFANEQAAERGVDGPGAVPLPQHARHRLRDRVTPGDLDERDHHVRRPARAVPRVRAAAAERRPLRLHHRLLQRRHRRAVQGGQPDRPALHVQHPPAQRVLQGPGRERLRADHRHRPHRPTRSRTGSCALSPPWPPGSRTRSSPRTARAASTTCSSWPTTSDGDDERGRFDASLCPGR